MTTSPDAQVLGLGHGDHVCGFYYTHDERDAMLLPYLREGLARGDKCVAVVDSLLPQDVVRGVGDASAAVATGQLEVYDSDQTYLRTGSFVPDLTIGFWEERTKELVESGEYDLIRLLGELSWLDRSDTPREAIVRYESWADGFVSRYPISILCLYDLRRLGSSVLLDLLRTHPKLLMGGLLIENPHHIPGDEFVAG